MLRTISLLTLSLAVGGCFMISSDEIAITYDVDPQEFAQDFGTQSGTLADVSCAADASICAKAGQTFAGATPVCDDATKKCVLKADLRLVQTLNLATQKNFPSTITNSSLIKMVEVKALRYWSQANSLTFDTPPLDLYIGSQTVRHESDAGATQLGTIPAMTASKLTACKSGVPGTKASACDVALTEAGKKILGTLAKDYKNPFNLLVVAHVTVASGQPIPSGKLDLFVQPTLAFVIPLK